MSDTAIQHKRVKMGMSDTEISTFWGAKIQHFWASQEYNIYMHIQGSCWKWSLLAARMALM